MLGYLPVDWARAGAHSIAVGDLLRLHHVAARRRAANWRRRRSRCSTPRRPRCSSPRPRACSCGRFWPFIALLNGLGTRLVRLLGLRAAERPLDGALGGRAEDAGDRQPGGGRPRGGRGADAPPRLRLRRPDGRPRDGAAHRDERHPVGCDAGGTDRPGGAPAAPVAAGLRQGRRRRPRVPARRGRLPGADGSRPRSSA